MSPDTVVRMARATDQLERVVRFYVEGLGLSVLGSFEDHDGFDGVMVGVPGARVHLEFTRRRGCTADRAPADESLLVFYLPDRSVWQAAIDRLRAAGSRPVPSSNPYWDRHGRTFTDPDGYRVVLSQTAWSPSIAGRS